MGSQVDVHAIRCRKDYRQDRSHPSPVRVKVVHNPVVGNLEELPGFLNEMRNAVSILANLVQMSLQLFYYPLAVSVWEIAILNEGFLGSEIA
jgi:hypothetical protein